MKLYVTNVCAMNYTWRAHLVSKYRPVMGCTFDMYQGIVFFFFFPCVGTGLIFWLVVYGHTVMNSGHSCTVGIKVVEPPVTCKMNVIFEVLV